MVDIRSREELEAWLNARPREVARETAVVIAARVALRVALVGATVRRQHSDLPLHRASLLLRFRRMAAPWVAAAWPGSDSQIITALFDFRAATAGPVVGDTPAAAAAAAGSTVLADSVNAATIAARAAETAASAIDDANSIWAAVSADATALEAPAPVGMRPSNLAIQPLWPTGIPTWALEHLAQFQSALLDDYEDWGVWRDWYEARLYGHPVNANLELARVMIPESTWKQGPKVVNAHIKRLIEEHEKPRALPEPTPPTAGTAFTTAESDTEILLSQRPAAFSFAIRDGRVAAAPQLDQPADADIAQDIHEAVREKAIALARRMTQSNAHARAGETIQRLLDALSASPFDLRPGQLLMRYRSLEADAAAFDSPEGRQELFPDAISMMRDLARSVDDLMGLYPSVRKIQAASLALELQRSDVGQVQELLGKIRDIAEKSESVEPSAQEALAAALPEVARANERIGTAKDDTERAAAIETQAETVALQVLDHRNFIAAVVKPLASAGRWIGGEIAEVGGTSWQAAKNAVPRAVGASVEGLVKGGIAVLVAHLAGSVAGLAVLVASLRPLARQAEEAAKTIEKAGAEQTANSNSEGSSGSPGHDGASESPGT